MHIRELSTAIRLSLLLGIIAVIGLLGSFAVTVGAQELPERVGTSPTNSGGAGVTATAITSATQLTDAMDIDSSLVVSASLDGRGDVVGSSDLVGGHVFDVGVTNPFGPGFSDFGPTDINGNSFAAISTGDASQASLFTNTSGSLSTPVGGLDFQNTPPYGTCTAADCVDLGSGSCNATAPADPSTPGCETDLFQLSVTLTVPPGKGYWSVDWKFLSEEWAEYTESKFNDTFLIEVSTVADDSAPSTFEIGVAQREFSIGPVDVFEVTSPNNVAFDPKQNPVTITTSGLTSMSATNSAGTTYDGATAKLTTFRAIAPDILTSTSRQLTIVFSVMDLGDSVWDTTVFLDNFQFVDGNDIVEPTAVTLPVRWCILRNSPTADSPAITTVLNNRHVAVQTLLNNVPMNTRSINFSVSDVFEIDNPNRATLLNTNISDVPLEYDTDVINLGGNNNGVIDPQELERFVDDQQDGNLEDNTTKILNTKTACQSRWQAEQPDVTGITIVNINQFVNTQRIPDHTDGNNRRVRNGFPIVGNTASQLSQGWSIIPDLVTVLAFSDGHEDPNEKWLSQGIGGALSLPFPGDGFDDNNNGLIDDFFEFEQAIGNNLMQNQVPNPPAEPDLGLEVKEAQFAQIFVQALNHIPDRITNPVPPPLAKSSADPASEVEEALLFGDIIQTAVAVDSPESGDPTITFSASTMATLPDPSTTEVVFNIDADNDATTGGVPDIENPVDGVEVVGSVEIEVNGGVVQATPSILKFDPGSGLFTEEVLDPSVIASVTDNFVNSIASGQDITLQMSAQYFASISGIDPTVSFDLVIETQFFSLSNNSEGITGINDGRIQIDGHVAPLNSIQAIPPQCNVSPKVALPGEGRIVSVSDFPGGAELKVFLGTTEVVSGGIFTDGNGNAQIALDMSSDTPGGVHFVGITAIGTSVQTQCSLIVNTAPTFDTPPTPPPGAQFGVSPGSKVSFPVQASDPEGHDVEIVFVGPAGAVLNCNGVESCEFEWTPGQADIGVHTVSFSGRDQFGLDTGTRTIEMAVAPIINNVLALTSMPSFSFDFAKKQSTISAEFINVSTSSIGNLFFSVAILSGPGCPCTLLIGGSSAGGVGVITSVDQQTFDDNGNGLLDPNEKFTKEFIIQHSAIAPINFFVQAHGIIR